MSDNRTKEEIKAAMRKAADFFGQHVNHRTKRVDEISVTEHMLKMSQRIAGLEAENARLQAIVDEQAEDEGLWFVAETAPEAYLQQELRRLHAAIDAARKP